MDNLVKQSIVWDKYWKTPFIKRWFIEKVRDFYFAKIFAEVVCKDTREGRVLEAGCGSAKIMRRLGNNYITVGCDSSLESLKIARGNCRYLVFCDIRQLPFKDKSFELVFNQGVMEHFSDFEFCQVLKEFKRIGKKIAIVLPSKTSIFRIYNPFKEIATGEVFFSKKRLKRIFNHCFCKFEVKYLAKTFFISIVGYGYS